MHNSFTSSSDTAMKQFLIKTVLFSAIILLLLIPAELFVRRITTPYSIKNHFCTTRGEDISTLILGNSHAYYGIRPDILGDSTFSLANVSQHPDNDLSLLRHYGNLMPNLKRIIIPVSYTTFRDLPFEETSSRFRAISYKTQMHLPDHSDFSTYNMESSEFRVFAGKIKNLFVHKPSNTCDSLGFGTGYTLARRSRHWKASAAYHISYHTQQPRPERAAKVTALFDSIHSYCSERGIELVLVSTPLLPEYRELRDSAQLAEMQTLVHDIVSRHSLRYLDFSADNDFTDADFFDADHLNDCGAAKLTLRLKAALD